MNEKYILLVFIFLFSFSDSISQVKISKIKKERKGFLSSEWTFFHLKTWEYNTIDKVYLYSSLDQFGDPKSQTLSLYDNNKNLSYQKHSAQGLYNYEDKYEKFYSYDNENRISEIIENGLTITFTGGTYSTKDEFIYGENLRSHVQYESYENPIDWKIKTKTDSFFNSNNCLIEVTKLEYSYSGELGCTYKHFWEYYDDCVVKCYTEWKQYSDTVTSSKSRTRYEYSAMNDTTINIAYYDLYNNVENQWWTSYENHKYEKSKKLIKLFSKLYFEDVSYADTLIETYSYDNMGKLKIFKRIRSDHFWNDLPLELVQRDSFNYIYDENNLLRSMHYSSYSADNPQYNSFTNYTYYCNDLLKSKTVLTSNGNQVRFHYDYFNPPECISENTEENVVVIFPNPSSGKIKIVSKQVFTSDLKISILSLNGDVLISKNYNYLTNEIIVRIPREIENGMYIVSIENNNAVYSEIILLQRN